MFVQIEASELLRIIDRQKARLLYLLENKGVSRTTLNDVSRSYGFLRKDVMHVVDCCQGGCDEE